KEPPEPKREFGFITRQIAFAPDNRTMALAATGRAAYLVDLQTSKVKGWIDPVTVGSMAFSPNGKLLAISDPATRKVSLWDVATQAKVLELEPADNLFPKTVAFTPEGTELAVAAGTAIQLWDLTRHNLEALKK